MLNAFANLLGIESQSVSHKEKIISGIGAFLGIFIVYLTSRYYLGPQGSVFILASMGSSAVLLFAVPHGALSQPWALLGGHLLSALVGVTCVQIIDNQLLAASLAVGLSVTVMYYARCTHPPGGATALGAVLGGTSVHELGYQFVITPVMLNTVIILLIAIMFNALFQWRRYPVSLKVPIKKADKTKGTSTSSPKITHEGFVYALSQIDTFIDVDESDLLRIYELATRQTQDMLHDGLQVKVNACYSNGEYGNQWSVRQVTNLSKDDVEEKEMLTFKVVAGFGRRKTGVSSVEDFINWSRYEVFLDEDNWRKVEQKHSL